MIEVQEMARFVQATRNPTPLRFSQEYESMTLVLLRATFG